MAKKKKELAEMKLRPTDASAAFSPDRGERSFQPERALQLGYVDLGDDHPRPEFWSGQADHQNDEEHRSGPKIAPRAFEIMRRRCRRFHDRTSPQSA